MTLYWYGERGIVNALVTRVESLGIEGVKQLLGCVQWANPEHNQWISRITSATLVVEIGLAHFGDPDLIVVCRTEDGEPFGVFLEAKVVPYRYSADQGGPSRIQRQLTLKYRFAKALKASRNNRIIETPEFHAHYRRGAEGSDQADSCADPRQLAKPSVLAILREAGLYDVPSENFRFVAWTWDRQPFFNSPDFSKSSFRPLFLKDDGTEDWELSLKKLGWLGYQELIDNGQLTDDAFRQALRSMLPSPVPNEVETVDCNGPNLQPYNINARSSTQTKAKMARLESIAQQIFPLGKVQRLPGSTSVTLVARTNATPKVLIKLLPRDHGKNEYIKLGISASLNRQQWGGVEFSGPECIGGQPFFTFDLSGDEDNFDIAANAFAELADCIAGETQDEEAQ